MLLGTPFSELPISSLPDMESRFNGEIILITLSLQPSVSITLELQT